MLQARLTESGHSVKGLLLDLADGIDAAPGAGAVTAYAMLQRVVQWNQQRAPQAEPIKVIAFGPHVQAELLAGIKNAGADEVMTRGALDANLPAVLTRLNA